LNLEGFISCFNCIFLGATNTPVQVQQRVQILRGPDGKLQVRGLLPGQQLVQMPDGKLHVLNVSQTVGTTIAQGAQTKSTTTTTTPQVIH
jgi:nucleosome-remodeling factor subunit BPTF